MTTSYPLSQYAQDVSIRIVVGLAMALLLSPLMAQNAEIDSLRVLVQHTAVTGTLKDSLVLRDLELIGMKALNMGATDTALAATAQSIAILEKFKGANASHPMVLRQMTQAYRRRGMALQDKDDYPGSLACYQLYQQYAERADRMKDVGASYMMMAACFREMQDTTKAIELSHRAISILSALPPSKDLGSAYMGLGALYSNAGRRDSATYWLQRSIPIWQLMKSVNKEGAVYLNLVQLFLETGRKDSAIHYMEKARIVEPLWSGQPPMAQYDGIKAQVLIAQNKFKEAQALLNDADALTDGSSSEGYHLQHFHALTAAAAQNGDSALYFLNKGNALLLEDMNLDKARVLERTQVEFEHAKESALAEAKLQAERVQTRNALIGAGLLGALLVLISFLYRANRRTAKLLAAKNMEILAAQEQLVRSEKEREAEQVRTRIARDIHDEIGSELTKITLLGSEAESKLGSDVAGARVTLTRIRGLSKEVGIALGDVVWAVDPVHDTVKGLLVHSQAFSNRMLEGTASDGRVTFEHEGADRSIDPASKRDLFLILKEAVNNALKHATASKVSVEMLTDPKGYMIRVSDDGRGFATGEGTLAGNGLRNMRQRAERVKGSFDLQTSGSGTVVRISGLWP